MSPVFRRPDGAGRLGPCPSRPVQRAADCSSAAVEARSGGTVRGPTSAASSAATRRARVAAQCFGESSR